MTTSIPSAETLEAFRQDIDQIREETMARVGQEDAKYIRKVVRVQRLLDIGGRAVMVAGFYHWIWWLVGAFMLGIAKILDNMEIGHNVMHGAYDFMNDPHLNSRSFEWDNVCDAHSWRRTHNFEHHTYTNIIGKDRDFGYGTLRLSDDTKWRPENRWQFAIYVGMTLLFQWGVAYHELIGERVFFGKPKKDSKLPITREQLAKDFFAKIRKAAFRDYLFFPAVVGVFLGWPMFFAIMAGNALANVIRNVWASTIIFCGHFTENVHTFSEAECENETRGQWYYRQILGSSNLEGSKLLHIMSGHLSRQVEHHLFPDMPSYRYGEVAQKVRAVCKKHGIPYNTGSLFHQYSTVVARIIRYSREPKQQTAMA
ncbi:MAG: acyl-CoA desaturase [Oceanospirillaceae bacterium]|nr:acyl-CoA desaturase [Oceanospirillaceae bacterium]|tara:strand:+ start:3739 stop:4845 length:1107 start_codon:yes stop_codon:yes gene_type:complete